MLGSFPIFRNIQSNELEGGDPQPWPEVINKISFSVIGVKS